MTFGPTLTYFHLTFGLISLHFDLLRPRDFWPDKKSKVTWLLVARQPENGYFHAIREWHLTYFHLTFDLISRDLWPNFTTLWPTSATWHFDRDFWPDKKSKVTWLVVARQSENGYFHAIREWHLTYFHLTFDLLSLDLWPTFTWPLTYFGHVTFRPWLLGQKSRGRSRSKCSELRSKVKWK